MLLKQAHCDPELTAPDARGVHRADRRHAVDGRSQSYPGLTPVRWVDRLSRRGKLVCRSGAARAHAALDQATTKRRSRRLTTPASPFSSMGTRACSTPPSTGKCSARSAAWWIASQHAKPVRQDAAADQEHRRRAGDRQRPSSARARRVRMPRPTRLRRRAPARRRLRYRPDVVELDDAGDQAVDADRHQQRDADQHRDLRDEGGVGHRAERDRDDLGREDEVGAHRALDLVLLERDQVDRRDRPAPAASSAWCASSSAWLCRNLCASFSKPSKQRKAPPIISSGVTAQGANALMASAAGTRIALLTSEPLATAQTTGSSRSALHAGHLLRVQRQVVAEHAGGLLRRRPWSAPRRRRGWWRCRRAGRAGCWPWALGAPGTRRGVGLGRLRRALSHISSSAGSIPTTGGVPGSRSLAAPSFEGPSLSHPEARGAPGTEAGWGCSRAPRN